MLRYTFPGGLIFLVMLCMSGIGRDDVPLERYHAYAKDSSFDCVGELYVKGKFITGCVLVSERYVLTTAHGLYRDSKALVQDSIQTPEGMKPFQRPAYTYPVTTGDVQVRLKGQQLRCRRFIIHPLYADSFRGAGDYDLALLELEKPVTGIAIVPVYTGDHELGTRGVHAGYGEVSIADEFTVERKHKRRKMAGENMIDSVDALYLWADMDHPRLAGFNRMGDDKPLPLEWMGTGGDCGCPLFIEEGGKRYIAGISFAPAYYSDMYHYGKTCGCYYGFITGWTRLSAVQAWIKQVIVH